MYLEEGLGVHAHELSLLELFTSDEVAAQGGRDFGHDGHGVAVHRVITRLRQISREPQNRDPQSLRRLNTIQAMFINY